MSDNENNIPDDDEFLDDDFIDDDLLDEMDDDLLDEAFLDEDDLTSEGEEKSSTSPAPSKTDYAALVKDKIPPALVDLGETVLDKIDDHPNGRKIVLGSGAALIVVLIALSLAGGDEKKKKAPAKPKEIYQKDYTNTGKDAFNLDYDSVRNFDAKRAIRLPYEDEVAAIEAAYDRHKRKVAKLQAQTQQGLGDLGEGDLFANLNGELEEIVENKNSADETENTIASLVEEASPLTPMPKSLAAPEGALDANGNPILGYDENGRPIIGYDKNGNPIYGQLGNETDAQGRKVIGYDANGNPIFAAPEGALDANGNPILGYDENGRPILGYDKNGNPIYGQLGTETDAQGRKVIGYDANGNPIFAAPEGALDASGNPILGYDKDGRPIIGYDKNGNPIYGQLGTETDAQGRKVIGYDANGNPIFAAPEGALDANGNPILGYDKDGRPIIGYDANGNPIYGQLGTETDAQGRKVIGYDANGNPIFAAPEGALDANGNPILGYDKDGRPIIGYDKNGNPIYGKLGSETDAHNNNAPSAPAHPKKPIDSADYKAAKLKADIDQKKQAKHNNAHQKSWRPYDKKAAQKQAQGQEEAKRAALLLELASQWDITAAQPGIVTLQSQKTGHIKRIEVGDEVPGLGVIRSIRLEYGTWIVQGEHFTLKR